MNQNTATITRQTCPTCGHKARHVSLRTIRSLLKERSAAGFQDGESCCQADGAGCHAITQDTGWRFCDSPACDVVYFAEQGDVTFVKSQLKVEVGAKETVGDRPLCYCFDHSVGSIKRELEATGECTAVEDIRSRMKGEGCYCEVINASGSCCLGSVAKGIEIAKGELAATESRTKSKPPSGWEERIAKVGTIVSAIMASSCCWLPLVLLAMGVSGAGVAAALEAYRPLLMVITFGLLSEPREASELVERGGQKHITFGDTAMPAPSSATAAHSSVNRFSGVNTESKCEIVIRPANPTFEEGLAYAKFLDQAADGFIRFMLGAKFADVIADTFATPAHDFSFENALVAERDAVVIGTAAGYTAQQHFNCSDEVLRKARGFLALRMSLIQMVAQSL